MPTERSAPAAPASSTDPLARAFAAACELDAAGDDEGAKRAYLALLQADPTHLGTLTNLAALAAKLGHRSAAKTLLVQAVAVAPDSAIAHTNVALAFFDEDPSLARTHFEAALRLEPDNLEAHKGLAVLLLRQGEDAAAMRHGQIGFRGGPQQWLFRGNGKPVSLLLLISAMGNIAIDRLIDDRIFKKWTLVVEFHRDAELPPHDLVLNCVGDADLARGAAAFAAVDDVLARSSAPVVNPPSRIRGTGRVAGSERLRQIAGVITAATALWSRASLVAVDPPDALARSGFTWPLLVRSPGYHTGHHFVKVDAPGALPAAVATLPGDDLLVIQFLDTRSADGWFRKYRVMLIGGELYPLHLAIGSVWKLHYFSADMADHPEHRAEEEAFLRDMPGALGPRVLEALRGIDALLGLDYGGIDFAIDAEGRVVVFEANASMLIAPIGGDAERFAYRVPAFARATEAAQRLLLGVGTWQRRESRMTVRNLAGGPGALPQEVLLAAQQAVIELPGTGLSILGLNHRSALFRDILDEAEERLRRLLDLPASYRVLFLQGGATLQFSMTPLAMLPPGGVADYVVSGYWSQKAVETARHHGDARVIWDGASGGFTTLPRRGELRGTTGAAYLHYVSNETAEGLQFRSVPLTASPLVCDMSSDFLSRPLDVSPFSLVYAHAQKNLGPSGVTIVIARDDVIEKSRRAAPTAPLLSYHAHADARSILHTPPVFAIYVVLLTLRWIADDVGGLEAMGRLNAEKARVVRSALAASGGFYRSDVASEFASDMNVTFRCSSADLDARLVARAAEAGFVGIEGHRTRGGLRVSLYNGVTLEDAQAVADFLLAFRSA